MTHWCTGIVSVVHAVYQEYSFTINALNYFLRSEKKIEWKKIKYQEYFERNIKKKQKKKKNEKKKK